MRRFIVNVLLALVPVALMAGVNYTRDPAGLFGGGLEARIATVLASGHAVRDPGDYNPRLVNRDLIRLVPRAPDVIVLGSSRAMHIRASAFSGRTMRNEAVFSATVEDFEATLGMHDAADAWPREMVLALDPCVSEEFLKLYVAYKAETNFVDVVPQAKRLRLALNMRFTDVNDPKGLCKDVTGVGRWGNGDVEVSLAKLEDLPYVIGLVRQSLELQLGSSGDA